MPKIMLNNVNYSAPAASGDANAPYALFKGVFSSGNKEFSLSGAPNKILEQTVSLDCAGYSTNVSSKGALMRIRGYYGQSLAFCNDIYLIAPSVTGAYFGNSYVNISCNGYHFNNNFTIYPNNDRNHGYIYGWYSGGGCCGTLYVSLSGSASITITNIDIL